MHATSNVPDIRAPCHTSKAVAGQDVPSRLLCNSTGAIEHPAAYWYSRAQCSCTAVALVISDTCMALTAASSQCSYPTLWSGRLPHVHVAHQIALRMQHMSELQVSGLESLGAHACLLMHCWHSTRVTGYVYQCTEITRSTPWPQERSACTVRLTNHSFGASWA